MAATEAQKRASRKYYERRAQKGIKQHVYLCTEKQALVLKTVLLILRKIKNVDKLIGIDVSEDNTTLKLVFEDDIKDKA